MDGWMDGRIGGAGLVVILGRSYLEESWKEGRKEGREGGKEEEACIAGVPFG